MSDLGGLRRELTEFSQRSFNRHLVSGTGGNLSLRGPGTDTVLITPSGVSLGDIEPEMNILVNLDGEILDSPMNFKGSKETGFHLEAYRTRQGMRCSGTCPSSLCYGLLLSRKGFAACHHLGSCWSQSGSMC